MQLDAFIVRQVEHDAVDRVPRRHEPCLRRGFPIEPRTEVGEKRQRRVVVERAQVVPGCQVG